MENDSQLADDLRGLVSGDVIADQSSLDFYSHDASLFELRPKVIVFPKDAQDVSKVVGYVRQKAEQGHNISLTGRSGGTDMSGGAINESIVVAFERYFTRIGEVENNEISVQPGVYYHDFEPVTLQKGLLMPSYPASREICRIGGMVANNSGGEKSLVYGKTDRYVTETKIVLRDGKEHTFKALTKTELEEKLKEEGLEGDIYREIYNLVTNNADAISTSRPKVSKNSTGYNIWEVWDGKSFDINKLIVGSQGTLGLLTEVKFSLVPAKPMSGMVVVFLPDLNNLGDIINSILPLKPTSLESFDDHTLKFAFRFFVSFRETLGWKKFILLGLSFIPVLKHLIKYLPKLPKIIMLAEFEGETQEEIDLKTSELQKKMHDKGIENQLAKNKHQEEKFWIMRRESFNLLRKNVRRKHTAPFIDDLIVPPASLPEFLPKLTEIIERYKLLYTVAGHMGDGNFHIIPLMDLSNQSERDKIYPVLDEVTDLVLKYDGSLSGEHNDGLIRGPMLPRVFNPAVFELMKKVKLIFDPANIFNPHKKTDADLGYSKQHIRSSF